MSGLHKLTYSKRKNSLDERRGKDEGKKKEIKEKEKCAG